MDGVDQVRMRWTGHRLNVEAVVATRPNLTVGDFHALEHEADHQLRDALPNLGDVRLVPAG